MLTNRVVVQDLNDPSMPVVTEMIIDSMEYIGGEMIRFWHPDGTGSILNIKPGWNLTLEIVED